MDRPVRVRQWSGDIWQLHTAGWYVVDPTNAHVKANGRNVMGAGLSAQALARYRGIDAWYGRRLREQVRPGRGAGARVGFSDLELARLTVIDHEHRIIFAPVKLHWSEPADRKLIEHSLACLHVDLLEEPDLRLALPRLGCGNGSLAWEGPDGVKALVRAFLAGLPETARERVVVVSPA